MKQRIFTLLLLLLCGAWNTLSAQNDVPLLISPDMKNANGLINLAFSENWKYQPGDNLQWAEPDFEDSEWHQISPGGLAIDAIPDTLWPGYGWWRLTFKVDSTFYQENWYLYFYGWGAAEVYLDGKPEHTFGEFSTNQNEEITYSPIMKFNRSVSLIHGAEHTIAIRYSYHQAKNYNDIFYGRAGILGFSTGFATSTHNEYRAHLNKLQTATVSFSSAVLFVLLLIHFTLYLKFREDRANLAISLLIALLLISDLSVYAPVFTDPNMFWYTIAQTIWAYTSTLAIFLMPYVVASIFGIEKYKKISLYLLVFFPALAIFYHLGLQFETILNLILIVFAMILTGIIIWKAYKLERKGVIYVAVGALGTMIFVINYILHTMGVIILPSVYFYSNTVMIYTFFPFGLTLYIANQYGYLYGSLEKEVKERTNELRKAYDNLQQSHDELKAVQTQLIQQEKLASLGQLTAGIAHEIKNPLNFVNNFSEVSIELIEEARDEVKREKGKGKSDSERSGEPRSEKEKSPFEGGAEVPDGTEVEDDAISAKNEDSALILEILNDIEANLRKIHEHGSRADGIVKSMLQHSRGGSGKMEPTDLNTLIKEYVNLAFHGMRAGKNPINVDIELDLNENVGDVPLVGEDFSRVILNLCNNAFDAMREKLSKNAKGKSEKSPLEGSAEAERRRGVSSVEDYTPKLTVRTKSKNGTILIEIEDNGPGIPDEIKDKILQPFFTTKKGTEGTGLGLSITNDIVKAHGGSLQVSANHNDGTVIVIDLKKNHPEDD